MDQLKEKMNGETVMDWYTMIQDYPKVQTQAFISKPKRQRPTHQGPGGVGTRWRGRAQRRRTLFNSRNGWGCSVGLL